MSLVSMETCFRQTEALREYGSESVRRNEWLHRPRPFTEPENKTSLSNHRLINTFQSFQGEWFLLIVQHQCHIINVKMYNINVKSGNDLVFKHFSILHLLNKKPSSVLNTAILLLFFFQENGPKYSPYFLLEAT